MKISTGLIVVLAAMAIFYLRVAMLRGQKKRFEREYALKRRKVHGRSKGAALPTPPAGSPPFGVTSWVLVVLSLIITIAGVIMYNKMVVFGLELIQDAALIEQLAKFWYLPVAAGILLLTFTVKIEKPRLE